MRNTRKTIEKFCKNFAKFDKSNKGVLCDDSENEDTIHGKDEFSGHVNKTNSDYKPKGILKKHSKDALIIFLYRA